MTTIDYNDTDFAEAPVARGNVLTGLARLFRRLRERRQERAALMELSRLDAHLLRDMGIEPGDVYDALDGRRSSVLFNPLRQPARR
jgi:uncharacterized protein YjiS (DUF1127 family)